MANGRKMWNGNVNITKLLFCLKIIEILHQERRGQVNTTVIEHINPDLVTSSTPINQSMVIELLIIDILRIVKNCLKNQNYDVRKICWRARLVGQ